jgi:hypothetical protein
MSDDLHYYVLPDDPLAALNVLRQAAICSMPLRREEAGHTEAFRRAAARVCASSGAAHSPHSSNPQPLEVYRHG